MKGFRTLLFNGVVLGIGITDYLLDGQLLGKLIDSPEKVGAAIALVALVNKILRFVTTTSVGSKE